MVAGLVDGPPPRPYSMRDWPDPPCAPFEQPSGDYAVLHVGASTPLKRWAPEKWRTLAERLAARGLAVVWSAGRGEEAEIAAVDPGRTHRSVAGVLDLAQLWHLLKGARLLVAPDTGVAHLGRIVGTPTVTLFGPGSAVICGPGDFWRASPYRAVTVPDFPCRDQRVLFKREIDWVRRCGRSTAECPAPRCMHAIDLAMVEGAIDALIGGAR
jgi:ADP-heptose:LPS heptosyltransferase